MAAEPHTIDLSSMVIRAALVKSVHAALIKTLTDVSGLDPDKALVDFAHELFKVVIAHRYLNTSRNPHLVYVDAFGDDGITSVYAIGTSRRGELSITVDSAASFLIKDILRGITSAGLRPVTTPTVEIRGTDRDNDDEWACTLFRFNVFHIENLITKLRAQHAC